MDGVGYDICFFVFWMILLHLYYYMYYYMLYLDIICYNVTILYIVYYLCTPYYVC